jgi:TetR/AcrR family transcriptional repressor of bet genes
MAMLGPTNEGGGRVPKLGMEPIRKRQLIEATVASIHRNGFADTTVQTISRAAGVSPGIIHHYFGGKGALLAATMRALMVELRGSVVPALRAARGPRERIEAIIDASFAHRQFQPQVIVTWLAFWGQAPHEPELARLQRIYARRLEGHFRHDLRPLVGARAGMAAAGLAAMIDGLWLSYALGRADAGPGAARGLARDYLHRLLAA